jgi:hypothetical protein
MKTIVLFSFVLLSLVVVLPVTRPLESESMTIGVFAGTSLCAEIARPLLNIPAEAQCDRTKWNLTLYANPRTQSPTTYRLRSEYGYHVDNRTLIMKGSHVREGNWRIATGGKADRYAPVYQLDPSDPQRTIAFQRIDSNIIHLLERDGSLVIGNAAQSFTLSRIDKPTNAAFALEEVSIKRLASTPNVPTSTPVRVFGGRTPCREVAGQLKHPVAADCMKLKWELTLNQDPKTFNPTTFKMRGTLFRDFEREGKWSILQGRSADANATIYKLDFDKVERPLFLLKADDNILFFLHNDGSLMVGNSDFSYTLNRESDSSPNELQNTRLKFANPSRSRQLKFSQSANKS